MNIFEILTDLKLDFQPNEQSGGYIVTAPNECTLIIDDIDEDDDGNAAGYIYSEKDTDGYMNYRGGDIIDHAADFITQWWETNSTPDNTAIRAELAADPANTDSFYSKNGWAVVLFKKDGTWYTKQGYRCFTETNPTVNTIEWGVDVAHTDELAARDYFDLQVDGLEFL